MRLIGDVLIDNSCATLLWAAENPTGSRAGGKATIFAKVTVLTCAMNNAASGLRSPRGTSTIGPAMDERPAQSARACKSAGLVRRLALTRNAR